jgi:hypothetical protein
MLMRIRYDKFGHARYMILGYRLGQPGFMILINSTRLVHIKAVYSLEWKRIRRINMLVTTYTMQ